MRRVKWSYISWIIEMIERRKEREKNVNNLERHERERQRVRVRDREWETVSEIHRFRDKEWEPESERQWVRYIDLETKSERQRVRERKRDLGPVHMVLPNRNIRIRIAQKKLCENIPRMHHTGSIWVFHKKLYHNSSRIG